MKRILGLAAAVVLLATGTAGASVPPELADPIAQRPDNYASAIVTRDGKSVFRFAFDIDHVSSDVVNSSNRAYAAASCSRCDATAIAVQFVIVEGSPRVFVPENSAVAINYLCSSCITAANAYQVVVQRMQPVRLSQEARRRVADLRDEIRALRDVPLTPADLKSRLDSLVAAMKQAIENGLVPARRGEREEHELETPSSELARSDRSAPTSGSKSESHTPGVATATLVGGGS